MATDPAIALALALGLAALLAASALHKARTLPSFVEVVRHYRLAPDFAAPFLAILIAALEAALAAGLLAPGMRALAGIGAAALFALYAGAIGFNLMRGRVDIDCGCSFGPSGDRLTPALLARNVVLVLAAVIVASPTTGRALGAFDFAGAALFALSAAAMYMTFEKLRANAIRFARAGRPL